MIKTTIQISNKTASILPSRYPVAPKDPKFKTNKPKLSAIMQDVSKLKFKVKNVA